MSFALRPYQAECVLAIKAAWDRGVQRPAAIMPTGTGKTFVFSILTVIEESTYVARPVILVNRDELVKQTVKSLQAVARPGQKIGIIKASVDESRTSNIVVASIQTLSRQNRLDKISRDRFNLIICDEAHYSDAPSWRRVLEHFGGFTEPTVDTWGNPLFTRVVGFTATMTRAGKHKLGEIWQEVVYEHDTRWAIDNGFLVPPRAITVTLENLDLSKVKVTKGDFAEGDLGKAMTQANAGPALALAYNTYCRDDDGELRRGIVFAPTIDTATQFAADFNAAGIPTILVIGETDTDERQAAYDLTRRGVNKVLMSVGVLTTGFDLPAVEVAVIARPTKAKGLYIQMVGRALRTSPETGKKDALILDVVGATRLGLASIADLALDEPDEEDPDVDEMPPGNRRRGIINDLDVPDDVGWVEVDPFDGIRKKAALRKGSRSPWKMTKGGVPFRSLGRQEGGWLFLWQDGETWTVGRKPKFGRAEILHEGLAFPEAVLASYAHHPLGKSCPPDLKGAATEGQLSTMDKFGVTCPTGAPTRQEASDLLDVHFASQALDR